MRSHRRLTLDFGGSRAQVAVLLAVTMLAASALAHTPRGHRHHHHRRGEKKVKVKITEEERKALLKSLEVDKGKYKTHSHSHGGHTHSHGGGPAHSRGGPVAASTAPPAVAVPTPVRAMGAAGLSGYTAQSPMQSMNPDISLLLDTAGAWFSDDKPQQSGAHDPNETGFVLQQLELAIESVVDPYFDMRTNIVFTPFGVEIEEALGRTLALPHGLQMRFGQFLTRLGRINPTHLHSWSFVDQPLVIGKMLGGDGLRGLGVEASWMLPLPWYVEVIGASQRADGACCARSFYGGDALPVSDAGDLLHSTRIAQFFPIDRDLSVMWGLSAAFGPNASGPDNRTAIYASDLYVRYRPIDNPQRASLSWQTEAMMRRRQMPSDVLVDWGMLSQLVWRYALRWETSVRFEQVSGVNDDPLDPFWDGLRRRYAAQWTFLPTEFSRLRLQGSVDVPSWRARPVYAMFFAVEVFVGTHGAHNF